MSVGLWIPRWHPATLNQIMHGHWSNGHKLKKADRQMVAAYAARGKLPKATGMRRVALTIVLKPRQRGADPDAYQKSLGDALVHCGLLMDDNRQHVEWAKPEYERGDLATWGTRIVLEDVCPA